MAGKLGMWQPTRKDGKNWAVKYAGTYKGGRFQQSRYFRIRDDAAEFKKKIMAIAAAEKEFSITSAKVSKI